MPRLVRAWDRVVFGGKPTHRATGGLSGPTKKVIFIMEADHLLTRPVRFPPDACLLTLQAAMKAELTSVVLVISFICFTSGSKRRIFAFVERKRRQRSDH